jgi:hypothetical protein
MRPAATQRREEHIDGRQVVAGTRVSGGDAVSQWDSIAFHFCF